jgi:DNA-binding response OmpR family regulator
MDVRTWTVCVVEPNRFEAQLIGDLLRHAGVQKRKVYGDADSAMAALELYEANVVIVSYELGETDAAGWIRAFRRNERLADRKAAIFVTSSAFSRSMAEQCRRAGANALIGKPLSGKVLTATISKVLSRPRPFVEGDDYVGPCRRAGIVTAGPAKKRRRADHEPRASAPAA